MSAPAATPVSRLGEILRNVFGHDSFRPFQEAVCRAVAGGRDALLVMPTGAGKSLCYQLPGMARAGTTLVISPLIALMEDHVAKMRALGLAAERIHSGRERLDSRQVCRDYLDGKLDFLFIAPERLSVPGFPEMLARRTPALVAVDEAHCISHWGHDFRPDYRLLGARLPALRPAPFIALTATATPRVQDDITLQLGLTNPGRFIHGFRRTNLAVEVFEAPPSRRAELVREVLAVPARRPAIVYTPTRRESTELAADLKGGGKLEAVAYHAGMAAKDRDDVQRAFLEGRAEIIVATIAFGMGIDKPDVRTVVHTALPGSVEGYYQEIGRAGRDGLPSRAILLHSYGDVRTHEFFLERDYPESDAPNASSDAQREHRKTQLVLMRRFAEGASCRMLQLVRHFGDDEDSGAPCGICDVCSPMGGIVTKTRRTEPMEEAALRRALELLRERDGQGTGQLHRGVADLFPSVSRRSFEELLGGLARERLIRIEDDAFEKDGQTIRFRRAYLTSAGWKPDAILEVKVPVAPTRLKKGRKAKKLVGDAAPEAPPGLVEALRSWRLEESRRQAVPAFHVLSNRTLLAIAQARPEDREGLLAVSGVGPKCVEKYGARILSIVEASS
jgi:DNA topoisomerase-3